MKIYRGFNEAKTEIPPSVFAIGNFDGVHLGHLSLLERAQQLASSLKVAAAVYTFWPHPQSVLQPDSQPLLICTREQKMRLFEQRGVTNVVEEPFTLDFAAMSAELFVKDVIAGALNARAVVTGQNFRFGHNAQGTSQKMQEWLEPFGIAHEVLPSLRVHGDICSSSRIRDLVLKGALHDAAALLGRPYAIAGVVVKGDGRGRSINVPTANLKSTSALIPPSGVYATRVRIDNGDVRLAGATNIGTRPTFTGSPEVHIETHILGFTEDIYGKQLEIEFVDKIREEKKFAGVDELVAQIHLDLEELAKRG